MPLEVNSPEEVLRATQAWRALIPPDVPVLSTPISDNSFPEGIERSGFGGMFLMNAHPATTYVPPQHSVETLLRHYPQREDTPPYEPWPPKDVILDVPASFDYEVRIERCGDTVTILECIDDPDAVISLEYGNLEAEATAPNLLYRFPIVCCAYHQPRLRSTDGRAHKVHIRYHYVGGEGRRALRSLQWVDGHVKDLTFRVETVVHCFTSQAPIQSLRTSSAAPSPSTG